MKKTIAAVTVATLLLIGLLSCMNEVAPMGRAVVMEAAGFSEAEIAFYDNMVIEIESLADAGQITICDGELKASSEIADLADASTVTFSCANLAVSDALLVKMKDLLKEYFGEDWTRYYESSSYTNVMAVAAGDRYVETQSWLTCRFGEDWGFFASRAWGNSEQNGGSDFSTGFVKIKCEILGDLFSPEKTAYNVNKVEVDKWQFGINVKRWTLIESYHYGIYGGTRIPSAGYIELGP